MGSNMGSIGYDLDNNLPRYLNSVLEVPEFYVLFDIDKFDLIFAYFVLFHVNNFPSLVPT